MSDIVYQRQMKVLFRNIKSLGVNIAEGFILVSTIYIFLAVLYILN